MNVPPTHLSLPLASPDETARFGRDLARHLMPGDVVLLHGEIGTGKSHLARAIITYRLAEVGMLEDVPSPTFTLVQSYQAGEVEIWHADLYRLSAPDEIIELGLTDAFETAICLIEWPEQLGADRPEGALDLTLTVVPGQDEARLLTLEWGPHTPPHLAAYLDVLAQ